MIVQDSISMIVEQACAAVIVEISAAMVMQQTNAAMVMEDLTAMVVEELIGIVIMEDLTTMIMQQIAAVVLEQSTGIVIMEDSTAVIVESSSVIVSSVSFGEGGIVGDRHREQESCRQCRQQSYSLHFVLFLKEPTSCESQPTGINLQDDVHKRHLSLPHILGLCKREWKGPAVEYDRGTSFRLHTTSMCR